MIPSTTGSTTGNSLPITSTTVLMAFTKMVPTKLTTVESSGITAGMPDSRQSRKSLPATVDVVHAKVYNLAEHTSKGLDQRHNRLDGGHRRTEHITEIQTADAEIGQLFLDALQTLRVVS